MATNINSGHVTFISLPLHNWLHKRASVLRYNWAYIACLHFNYVTIRRVLFSSCHRLDVPETILVSKTLKYLKFLLCALRVQLPKAPQNVFYQWILL